jgi:hypothetical protein
MSKNYKRNGEGEYSTLNETSKRIIDDFMKDAIEENKFVALKHLMHSLHSYVSSRVCIYFNLF